MTTITATVRDGRLELNEPLNLPDGTVLQIPLPEEDAVNPEEIERVLAAMDSMEPLQMTDAELAAWEADRQARKEWEKARFFEHAEKLHRMWQ